LDSLLKVSIKTIGFGLKPGNCVVFNCPVRQLADGAINARDIQGFSHIKKIVLPFFDWTHIKISKTNAVFQDESDNHKLSKVSGGPPVGGPLSDVV
jgi:hypothetical protein